MNGSNSNLPRQLLALGATLVSGTALAHSGGPHQADSLTALAHILTSWHHLLGALAMVAAGVLIGRMLFGRRARGSESRRRTERGSTGASRRARRRSE